jgi:GNAT superfamily N-acetyltransferase
VTARPWARLLGVALAPVDLAVALEDPRLRRALADGLERGYAGDLPGFPRGVEAFAVREGGADVGLLVLQRDCPGRGEAAVLAVVVAVEHRGRSCGAKALLAAERRLHREGFARVLARVPRTNGRGLYFMLRAGYVPVPLEARPDDAGDATWFARTG